jgi:nucleoside-diphosphate-sugar epimerase
MRIVVTGATGFVGACLVRRLVHLGYDVHIFTRRQSNKWRIADIVKDLVEHEVDLCTRDAVQRAIKQIKPIIIYHLAAYGGFSWQQDTKKIIESNFMGTVNLLRACETVGFDYFVNTGSSSEYGFKQNPMREADVPEPIGDYAVSKVAGTLFCQLEARQKKLPIITARLFSPYGNWDDPKRFIPYVIKSLLRNEAPKLSTPCSVRDYIFIDDILDFYQMVIKQPIEPGNIINVGSGIEHSLGEVVAELGHVIGKGVEPVWGATGMKRPEPSHWVADITKAKLIGWKLHSNFEEGLRKTVHWMQDHLDLYP